MELLSDLFASLFLLIIPFLRHVDVCFDAQEKAKAEKEEKAKAEKEKAQAEKERIKAEKEAEKAEKERVKSERKSIKGKGGAPTTPTTPTTPSTLPASYLDIGGAKVSMSLRMSPCVSVCLRSSPYVSMCLHVCPCISVCLRLSPFVYEYLRLSPFVSVCLRVLYLPCLTPVILGAAWRPIVPDVGKHSCGLLWLRCREILWLCHYPVWASFQALTPYISV